MTTSLADRREYVTMGRFLAYVPDGAVLGAITALPDEAVLRTAFVLEHKERLDHAVALLPIVRLMRPESRERIAGAPAFNDRRVLAEIIVTTADAPDGLWADLAPLVGALPPDVLPVAAEVAGALSAARLERIVAEALRSPATIAPLRQLLAAMDDDGLQRVGDAIVAVVGTPEAIPAAVLEAVAAASGGTAAAGDSRR